MSENLRDGSWRRLSATLLALSLAVGCEGVKSERHRLRSAPSAAIDSVGPTLRNVSTVGVDRPRKLTENSAAAMSRRQPGVLFTINDSGNEAVLFAIDTTGADRGVWRVLGATNVDWEAAAIGPCGGADAAHAGQAASDCVYIGDTGDNLGSHPSRAIYRVAEPAAGAGGSVNAEILRYTYTDRPHDVEAMYVAPNGDVVLITKRPIANGNGQLRPALVFRLSATAWKTRDRVVAQLVDSLPIVPGSVPLRMVTDASLAPDGRHVAVRTYSQVYVFATDSLTGAVNHAVAPTVCDLVALGEAQGEGVTWANASGRLVFTSEGRRAPLHLGDCAVP
jgi:hypothetical protein